MNASIREEIGAAIAASRKACGLTQRELSELSGVTAQNITKIEHGRYNLSVDILYRVCRPLGLKIKVEP